MRVVCAPDKMRGSLDAAEAAAALAAGVRAAGATPVEHPLADGGEGSRHTVQVARGGTVVSVDTVDALGRPAKVSFGCLATATARRTAVPADQARGPVAPRATLHTAQTSTVLDQQT